MVSLGECELEQVKEVKRSLAWPVLTKTRSIQTFETKWVIKIDDEAALEGCWKWDRRD